MPSIAKGVELIDALIMNDFDAVQGLLSGGEVDFTACDESGNTPLIWAVFSQEKDIIAAILECGASVNVANRTGTTVLMWAAQTGDPDVVEMILQRGADVTATNEVGQTALDIVENSFGLGMTDMSAEAKGRIVDLLKNPPSATVVAAVPVPEVDLAAAFHQAQLRKIRPRGFKMRGQPRNLNT